MWLLSATTIRRGKGKHLSRKRKGVEGRSLTHSCSPVWLKWTTVIGVHCAIDHQMHTYTWALIHTHTHDTGTLHIYGCSSIHEHTYMYIIMYIHSLSGAYCSDPNPFFFLGTLALLCDSYTEAKRPYGPGTDLVDSKASCAYVWRVCVKWGASRPGIRTLCSICLSDHKAA